MISYNNKQLLVSLHLPKCGGTSFNRMLKIWFHLGFHRHYFDNRTGKAPEKMKDTGIRRILPRCVHGHFERGSAIDVFEYYPEASQFITVFRDPLSAHASAYTYVQQCIEDGSFYMKDGTLRTDNIAKGIDDFIENHPSGLLNFIPFQLDKDNYRDVIDEYFIHIGIVERMEYSVKLLSRKLRKPYFKMPVLNTSSKFRDREQISERSRKIFREKHELEYAIYDYAVKLNS